jgi:flagellar basal body-associated protein FliL
MAEKPEKKGEEKAAPASAPAARPTGGEEKKPAAAKGGLFKSMPVLLGVVMVLEAAILFAAFKMFGGGPKAAHGADLATANSHEGGGKAGGSGGAAAKGGEKDLVELQILSFKSPNKVSGKTYLFEVTVIALTKPDCKETLEQAFKRREGSIQNAVRTIIAEIDPDKLTGAKEPGLETFRRQVKYRLEEFVGEGMIEDVLVTKCIPYRGD